VNFFFRLWLPEEADKVADRIHEHTNSLGFVHNTSRTFSKFSSGLVADPNWKSVQDFELSLRTAVESDTLASSPHAKEPVVKAELSFKLRRVFI
jgi:hypothetical protein